MLPVNYSVNSLIEHKDVVEELASRLGLRQEDLRVPKYMLLSLSVGITPLVVRELRARTAPWIYKARPLFIGKISDKAWELFGPPLVHP